MSIDSGESIFDKMGDSEVKKITLLSPVILLSLSYIYLLFYYTKFNISIFEYLTIDSFIILSLLPIGISVLVSIISIYVYQFDKVFDKFVERDKYWKYSLLEVLYGLFKSLVFVLPIYLVREQFDLKLFEIVYLYFWVIFISTLLSWVKVNQKTKSVLFTLLVSVTVIVYMSNIKGDRIVSRESYQYLLESDVYEESNSNVHFIIIGYVNGKYFLQPFDSNHVVVKEFHENYPVTIRSFQSPE